MKLRPFTSRKKQEYTYTTFEYYNGCIYRYKNEICEVCDNSSGEWKIIKEVRHSREMTISKETAMGRFPKAFK